jgi:hypothetical protein
MRAELPNAYPTTRTDLHRLAVYVISPARAAVNDQITLRSTPGGFGTPPFGSAERQIRVAGTDLVVSQYRTETVEEPITTLARAAEMAGIPLALEQQELFDVPPHGDVEARLQVDANAAEALADWFALAFDVLAAFLDECRAGDEPSPHVRLWPEHFDAAVDVGSGDRGGTYGLSPGDRYDAHPYVYASRWGENEPDPFYDSPFGGAWLRYADLVAVADPRAAALGFLRGARRRRLGH